MKNQTRAKNFNPTSIAMSFVIGVMTTSTSFAYDQERAKYLQTQIENKRIELAQFLVQTNTEGYICETDAYTTTVVQSLSDITDLWKGARTATLRRLIHANKKLTTNLAMKVVTNLSNLSNAEDMQKGLVGTTLYSPGEGVYGSSFQVSFSSKGKAEIQILDRELSRPVWKTHPGSWSVSEQKGHLVLELRYLGKTQSFKLRSDEIYFKTKQSGEIRFEGDQEEYPRSLNSSPSECEA